MPYQFKAEADSTAVRTALWRALHAELDALPHVLEDTLGLKLANPTPGWRERGDMHDTFAQRRPELASRLHVFEVDRPGPQAWKQERLRELGYYLTREANLETLREVATLAPGTVFAMTFLQPLERADASARPGLEWSHAPDGKAVR